MARIFKLKTVLGLGAILALSACSKEDEKYVDRPVEELYNKGLAEFKDKNYTKAAESFDEVERQHPYSNWAVQAQLMAAYAHYQNQKYEKALAALETFIQLHPAHEDVPYAYYLEGLCYYEQLTTVERDQKVTELAYETFATLLKRFPESKYARDAKLKMDLLRDMMAGKEMEVGRFYQGRKNYVAAMNRFREVIEKFQTTSHTPEALHRLVEVYLALGLKDEALRTGSVLGHNYPGNPWYADTYLLLKGEDFRPEEHKKGNSWIDRIWKSDTKS